MSEKFKIGFDKIGLILLVGSIFAFLSTLLSGYWLFAVFGIILTIKIFKRRSGNDISLLLLYILLGTISTIIYCFVSIIYVKIIFLALQAIFYSVVFPLSTSIALHENLQSSGTIFGITLSSGIAASIVYQPLIGYISQYFGKNNIVYVIAITAVFGFISVIILFKLLNNKYNTKFIIN